MIDNMENSPSKHGRGDDVCQSGGKHIKTDLDDKEDTQIFPTERLMTVEILPRTEVRTTRIGTNMYE